MVRINAFFTDKKDAEDYAQRVLNDYPPEGYDTQVHVEPDDDGWLVLGHRASSCD